MIPWRAIFAFVKTFWKEFALAAVIFLAFGAIKTQSALHERALRKQTNTHTEEIARYAEDKIRTSVELATYQKNLESSNLALSALTISISRLGDTMGDFATEMAGIDEVIASTERTRTSVINFLRDQPTPETCEEADAWFMANLPVILDLESVPGE